jgi:hypothetical protein
MTPSKDPNIIIREAWGEEKEVGFRGIEHIDMPEEEMMELIDKYGDTLIELDKIDEEYEGLEWCWQVGRIVSQMDDRGAFAKINRYTDIDIGDDWTLIRYVNFYKLFPEGNFDSRLSKSVYFELAIGERLQESKKAYNRLINYQDGDEIILPSVYEVRAWANIETLDIQKIVETIKREARGQTSNLNDEKILRGVRRVLIMKGEDPERVDKEDIAKVDSIND